MNKCLLIHGFTGGVFEVSPLADYLEQRLYRARTFTLSGHEGGRAALRRSDRRSWLQSAEDELLKLLEDGDNTSGAHIIGFSTGALIGSALSAKYPNRVRSLTLLSAPVFPLNPPEIVRTLASADMLRQYMRKFRSTPPKATREFRRMVRESFDFYPKIAAPTLIVQGTRDHLVRAKSAAYLRENLGSPRKEVVMVDGSGHMVCHCADKERVMGRIHAFIEEAGAL